jgi:hypothetical protein
MGEDSPKVVLVVIDTWKLQHEIYVVWYFCG